MTTRFNGISTSEASSKGSLTAEEATQRAYAHLRYIDRQSAVVGRVVQGIEGDCFEAQAKAFRSMISLRSMRGGKRGTRVAERIIFSLPNDLSENAENEILSAILKQLIPNDSEAAGWGVIHGDKPHNRHCHLLLVDGQESKESAQKRRPEAKRVRRADVIRMGDLGRPKELRNMIADEINKVASKNQSRTVESRSFKERGIDTPPTRHKGPQRLAQAARETLTSLFSWFSSSNWLSPISELFPDHQPTAKFLVSSDDPSVLNQPRKRTVRDWDRE